MRVSLQGKVVVVTGGARGIGLATSRALAARGARVVLGDLEADGARRAAKEVGSTAVGMQLDVTDPGSIARIPFEPLDVLVNNAGVYPGGRASRIDFDVVEETWRINALGARRLAG